MILDLDNLNPGTWFEMEGGGSVSLRICAGDDIRQIEKQTVKKRAEYKNGQRFEVFEINEDLRSELIWDFCIVDWKGLVDVNDKLIPCTKENKLRLMGKSLQFSSFVASCLDKIRTMDLERKEILEKN